MVIKGIVIHRQVEQTVTPHGKLPYYRGKEWKKKLNIELRPSVEPLRGHPRLGCVGEISVIWGITVEKWDCKGFTAVKAAF